MLWTKPASVAHLRCLSCSPRASPLMNQHSTGWLCSQIDRLQRILKDSGISLCRGRLVKVAEAGQNSKPLHRTPTHDTSRGQPLPIPMAAGGCNRKCRQDSSPEWKSDYTEACINNYSSTSKTFSLASSSDNVRISESSRESTKAD